MTAHVKGVSFSLSGTVLMERARDLVLSGQWREAIEVLTGSLEGMTVDQALTVLKGEAKLTGTSRDGSIMLEPDEGADGYLQDLDFQFGGLVRIEGGLYMPYLVVTDYGPEDSSLRLLTRGDGDPEFIPERMHDAGRIRFDQIERRARHYARAQATDRVEMCKVLSRRDPGLERTLAVVFSLAYDVPMWVKPESSPQKAVDRRSGDLEYTGYCQRYGSEDLSVERDPVRMRNQAKANFAEMAQTFDNRDMHQALEENLRAMADRTSETFAARRTAILEQNATRGYGMRRFDFGGQIGVRNIPEGPLVRWALGRTLGRDKAPAWDPVCPQGVKMVGDDPVHSDWAVGAGLENEDFFSGPFIDRQQQLMTAIQMEMLGLGVNVLVAGRPAATGTVVYAKPDTPCDKSMIAVIDNAGPNYLEIARTAAAVIALKGGALSHLAVVGLEEGFLIVRDPDAKKNYPEGSTVTVDALAGEIRMEALARIEAFPKEEDDAMAGPRP